MSRRSRLLLGLIAAALLLPSLASAHTLKPGFLLLRDLGEGTYAVDWTAPQAEPALFPRTSGGCALERAGLDWHLTCAGDEPTQVHLDGIRDDRTEVVVRVARADGEPMFAMMSRDLPMLELGLSGDAASSEHAQPTGFMTWLWLGIEHILIGTDHLLFVLGLVLLISSGRDLLATITSFTLAHSITLGAASLGAIALPSAPVESVIALSIVLLAVELARDEETLTHRKPWLVAFAFGLLHGFGFAGALGEIGLPQESIWMPLLSFNLGVEAGQLAFVAAVIGPVILLRKAPRAVQLIPVYCIGTVAMAWTIERVAGYVL
ncbi:MAG: HupE/UreJ family protein [Proteobacteria bacterium]|nr:HupE/UreJ family protein [Pseudomonadota bacterium]